LCTKLQKKLKDNASKIIAKSKNKIKINWSTVKKVHSTEQMPSFIVNKRLKDSENMTTLNNFFLTVNENSNLHQGGKR
jgi:hypothetical protein